MAKRTIQGMLALVGLLSSSLALASPVALCGEGDGKDDDGTSILCGEGDGKDDDGTSADSAFKSHPVRREALPNPQACSKVQPGSPAAYRGRFNRVESRHMRSRLTGTAARNAPTVARVR